MKREGIDFKRLLKVIGFIIWLFGLAIMVMLFMEFIDYIQHFPSNPIHQYIVGSNSTSAIVKLNDQSIIISDHLLRFVAIILSLVFLKMWLKIASTLIMTGADMIKQENESLNIILKKLEASSQMPEGKDDNQLDNKPAA